MTTEREMLDRLNVRYGVTYKNGSYVGRRFTRAEQVPTEPGRWGGHRAADFVAIDNWQTPWADLTPAEQETARAGSSWGNRYSLHAFEVKVSRSDLRSELNDLGKSEEWRAVTNYFWLVVPEPKIYDGMEIPQEWGILVSHGAYTLKQVRPARRTVAVPMPIQTIAGLTRAVAKTEGRLAAAQVEILNAPNREELAEAFNRGRVAYADDPNPWEES